MKNSVLTLMAILSLLLNSATAQTPEFWGMTSAAGSGNDEYYGVIFKTDGNGLNQTVEFDFHSTPGHRPYYSKLCQATNGKLYGMTSYGVGVIYEYDPVKNTSIKVHQFIQADGYKPFGSLIQATNGKLYGMTAHGGTYDDGVIFEFDPATGIYVKKFDFGGSNGKNPSGSLVQATNGKLYGMTN